MSTELTPKPAETRWLKIGLVLSLSINLAVAGMVAGVAMRRGSFMSSGAPDDIGAAAEFTYRNAVGALPAADRRALREGFSQRLPGREGHHHPDRMIGQQVLDALRADEFDAGVFRAALNGPRELAVARYSGAQDLLLERIDAMTLAERQAYADRLEVSLPHRRPPPGQR
jgi:uncharacterized membrane protein